MRITRVFFALALLLAVALSTSSAFAQKVSGAIYTTTKDGTVVNKNIYGASTDVYLNGGPQNMQSKGLSDGTYYFQVTDPSGKTLLSTDNAECRQLTASGGRVMGATGPSCQHPNGAFNPANNSITVQLAPFDLTPNRGAEYKVWLIPFVEDMVDHTDPRVLNFSHSNSKTDNFKVRESSVSQNSCQPSGSLSVLITGQDVHSYVPKGSWSSAATGVGVVKVEGLSTLPDINPIPIENVVNSCASNSVTGQTVCTANDNKVYIISGLSANPTVTPLSSAGSGTISFSQDSSCTNCGVAMDSVHNKAVIALSFADQVGGYQYLNLDTSSFDPAFRSQAPPFPDAGTNISENILVDPDRNLILSPNELLNYELVNVTTTKTPTFFEQNISALDPFYFSLDSAGEDCSTGIVLASVEDESSGQSQVYIADLSQAVFTPGTPGMWTYPSPLAGAQVQPLSESVLANGATGIAVAQGTHTGVITGENSFFALSESAITAIALPTTSGSGIPAITDWVTCSIGFIVDDVVFRHGRDPHTVTAYKSPSSSGHAIALLANRDATTLAVVDLTNMLAIERTPGTPVGHACATSPLPASVVTFIDVP